MLRSVKYGLYGAVLAGVVGGTVAFTAAPAPKTVRLVVDGTAKTVHTTDANVGAVLADAGFHVDSHDLVAPSASTAVKDGTTIVLKRGRLLRLQVDGVERDVWTTAPTVAQALADLGYGSSDFTSVSRSRRLPLTATDIELRTPKSVTVVHDGKTSHVTTTDLTVSNLLHDLGLQLYTYDRLSAPKAAPIEDGMTLRITRVRHAVITKTQAIPFATKSVDDPHLNSGTTKTVRNGREGLVELRWAAVYVDGKLVGKTKLPSKVLRQPLTRINHVGTHQLAPNTPAAGAPSPGSAQAIARSMMLQDYGWGQDQFSCLVQMWDRESGWRTDALNPSGAYGIPQALPGSKMASAGPDWQTSATTQIRWGLQYIASRYSTPCGAWSLWQQQGWY